MRASAQIVGRDCSLILSDPWDLGEALFWEPLKAIVVRRGLRPASTFGPEGEAIVIQLEAPFFFNGVDYEYLQGSPRHEGVTFDSLLHADKGVLCNFVRIPPKQVVDVKPFDLSWWRGGGGVIGTLSLR